MGAVEGRTGSSWGTMRLKSASAASISSQRGWGNEGLKWLERIVGMFTIRAGCESRKWSLDWQLEKGNRRSKKRKRIHLCFSHIQPSNQSHELCVLRLVCGTLGTCPSPWSLSKQTHKCHLFSNYCNLSKQSLYIHMTIWKSHYEFIPVLVSVDSVNSVVLSIL